MFLLAAPTAAQEPKPYSALSDCAIKEAIRLEPSGESADVVAFAAIGSEACADKLGLPIMLSGRASYDANRQVAFDRTVAAVVETRLKRKADTQ